MIIIITIIPQAISYLLKCLRATEIKRSEDRVMKVVEALKKDFINPFDSALDKQKLFSLVSGKPLPTEVAELLISAEDRGKGLQLEFNKRLDSGDESGVTFFDPIKREEWKGFDSAEKKTKVTGKSKSRDVTVQREILGLLIATSFKEQSLIDIDNALSFPLAHVPLALATSDGSRRKTAKSKLLDAALFSIIADEEIVSNPSCYALDLISTNRSIVNVPNTFR